MTLEKIYQPQWLRLLEDTPAAIQHISVADCTTACRKTLRTKQTTKQTIPLCFPPHLAAKMLSTSLLDTAWKYVSDMMPFWPSDLDTTPRKKTLESPRPHAAEDIWKQQTASCIQEFWSLPRAQSPLKTPRWPHSGSLEFTPWDLHWTLQMAQHYQPWLCIMPQAWSLTCHPCRKVAYGKTEGLAPTSTRLCRMPGPVLTKESDR